MQDFREFGLQAMLSEDNIILDFFCWDWVFKDSYISIFSEALILRIKDNPFPKSG